MEDESPKLAIGGIRVFESRCDVDTIIKHLVGQRWQVSGVLGAEFCSREFPNVEKTDKEHLPDPYNSSWSRRVPRQALYYEVSEFTDYTNSSYGTTTHLLAHAGHIVQCVVVMSAIISTVAGY